jgi:histidyl-tRNA synthetase
MSKQKPSIPKGTRDFGPLKMARRNYIFDIIKSVFEKYGYLPLETPSMENLSVLTGKYGDEGDKLLYKILNSGDFLSKTNQDDFRQGYKKLIPKIAGKGLRYDLTVPFARFVVMNQNEITFPFRRYQIQPVWRADRPQKGRYREFYQCDADVVGTNSLLCEAENMLMIGEVFDQLEIQDYIIKLNHREILKGITDKIGAHGREQEFCVAVDKLDKIGKVKVIEELRNQGFSDNSLKKLDPVFNFRGSVKDRLTAIKSYLADAGAGKKGIEDLESIFQLLEGNSIIDKMEFDMTLARGLSYYTGAIFEVKAVGSAISSSLSGGGRYDNLTGVFGLEGVSGVGFSFGVDRIYDVLEDLEAFPSEQLIGTRVMVVNFDVDTQKVAFDLVQKLRDEGISAEMYPEAVKLKKQFNYANKKQIPFVVLMGEKEMDEGRYGLKNMTTGEQVSLSIEEIIKTIKSEVMG